MQKKTKGETTHSGSLAFFPVPAPTVPPRLAREEAGHDRCDDLAGDSDLQQEVRQTFREFERQTFTVKRIAHTLDQEARRLSRLYGDLAREFVPDASSARRPLDVCLVMPLLEDLSRGVAVADIHKVLNVAREPIFPHRPEGRGKTAPRVFTLEQAVALYVIWRLGHSFHLVPRIRKNIADQITADVLRRIVHGEELGLAVTPFVAAVGELEEVMVTGYAEIVGFSLNGLVCQALRAYRSTTH
jgi:hypothetical protein